MAVWINSLVLDVSQVDIAAKLEEPESTRSIETISDPVKVRLIFCDDTVLGKVAQ